MGFENLAFGFGIGFLFSSFYFSFYQVARDSALTTDYLLWLQRGTKFNHYVNERTRHVTINSDMKSCVKNIRLQTSSGEKSFPNTLTEKEKRQFVSLPHCYVEQLNCAWLVIGIWAFQLRARWVQAFRLQLRP